MTQQEINDVEHNFKLICDNKEEFCIAAGMLLTMICQDYGVNTTIEKLRWYAQICDAINNDEINNITIDEKNEFINLHLRLKALYERDK